MRVCLFFFLIFGFIRTSTAEELNSLYYSIGESKSNYFDPEASRTPSVFRPTSESLGYSRQIKEDWMLSVSYEKVRGKGEWFSGIPVSRELYNKASSRSTTWQISMDWFAEETDDFDWNLSFAKVDTQDQSLFFRPEINEELSSDDQVFTFSFGKTLEFEEDFSNALWTFEWTLGTQFASLDVHLIDQVALENPIEVDAVFNQQSWTGFVDFNLTYWQVEALVVWGPYLGFSWNSELQLSGDLSVVVSNEQRSISLDEAGGRYSKAFRTPDSGRWQVGLQFIFDSGTNLNFNYAQDFSTASELEILEVVIGYSF